ncbi:MAG: hypothetical protein JRI97_02450 [Deltaproteobacteria bacterium]|nr:hypothetical protein [Deltaproteobacteria bacterium]
MKKPRTYERIAGPRSRLVTVHSLYKGPDHLLSVVNTGGYREEYRRFPYDDIQALSVAVLRWSRWSSLLTLALFLFLVWGAVAAEGGLAVFVAILAGVVGLGLLADLYMGAYVKVTIQTSVQRARLPAVKRMRTAMEVMREVREQVEAVQGVLPSALSDADLAAVPKEPGTREAAAGPPPVPAGKAKAGPESGRWHLALYYLLLAGAVAGTLDLHLAGTGWMALYGVLFCASVLASVGASIHQRNKALPRGLKNVTLAATVFLLGVLLVFHVYGMALGADMAKRFGSDMHNLNLYRHLASLRPEDMGRFFYYGWVACVAGFLVLGTLGLVLVSGHRAAVKAGSA